MLVFLVFTKRKEDMALTEVERLMGGTTRGRDNEGNLITVSWPADRIPETSQPRDETTTQALLGITQESERPKKEQENY